ncbi:PITH domain-containing protein [Mycena rebaudengoi]|nr:PITH domain-containing protein [Mycena rebaudengoi]
MATTSKDSGDVSLLEFLDLSQLNCLNEDAQHPFASIVSTKSVNKSAKNFVLSDADEQLLLNIPALRSIVITSSVGEQAPQRIKLLVNRPNIGFEDVEEAEEPEVAQILEISEDDVKEGRPIALRFVRFQTVTSLHATEETRIDSIDLLRRSRRVCVTTKDLSGLKKQDDH